MTSTQDPADVADVRALVRAAGQADGRPALDDHRWLDATAAPGEATGLLARDAGTGEAIAYAQVVRGDRRWNLELVVAPDHRHAELSLAPALLTEALDVVRSAGGGRVHLWVFRPTAAHDAAMLEVGLRAARDLWQMRRMLPVDAPWSLETRAFVPGRDDEAWLHVNNRAFHWHPEQSGWTIDDLRARQRESWFDPDGFLLHDVNGQLSGFCWTKVHRDSAPVLGEIYVVAVDPDFHGRGLGRALVLAGLDHLARRGIDMGMLYVDATNAPAVQLYEDLGFTVHHVDRAYAGDV